MVVKEDFLSRLRKLFGLNLYEAKIWVSLLSRGISTAGELSDISGVPRSRTYDILESLEKKGFIVMKLGKPIKFIALKPAEVIERVKKHMLREAQEMVKRLDEIKGTEVMNELNSLFNQGIKYVDSTELSGAIRGRTNLYNHLEMMIRNATKEVTIITTAEGIIRKFETLKPILERTSKRGVKIRIAVPITEKNYKIVKELSKIAEIRNSRINARMALIDKKEVMIMLLNDEEIHPNYDTAVWINSPFLGQAIDNLFEETWNKLPPLQKVKLK